MKAILASALVASALVGCGGAAPAPSPPPSREPAPGHQACPMIADDAFARCARELYANRKYADVIHTCRIAVREEARTDEQKTAALGVCAGIVPATLFHQGRLGDARDMIGTLCHGGSDDDRASIAARATLVSMIGMEGAADKEERIKAALVTFSRGCEVEPGAVADRALELSKR